MTYAVKRSLGYQPWGVTNPWVFADLSQPQRRRVPSRFIFQTHPPRAGMHPLGSLVSDLMAPEGRSLRMEIYSVIGLGLTFMFVVRPMMKRKVAANSRRRRGKKS